MQLTPDDISRIVSRVLDQVQRGGSAPASRPAPAPAPASFASAARGMEGIFPTMDAAVREAQIAQDRLLRHGLEEREAFIANMRRRFLEELEPLCRLAVEETGMGRVEDKLAKARLSATKTPGCEDLRPEAHSGDHGLTLVELAPFGVIGSISPCTNPHDTIVNNAISMIAAGNAVVFNPHPRAKRVSQMAISILNRAIVEAGGPPNLLCTVADPSLKSSAELMHHPDIHLLVVTGGEAVVEAAFQAGKKVIAAGPGNPPVVVDETADVAAAARHVVDGASFDNNLLCIAEKEAFVVESVADEFIRHMKAHGAYQVIGGNVARLERLVLKDGAVNRDWVGKDARKILEAIGIAVDASVRLVIVETDARHPFVHTEKLMPILPIVRVPDVNRGIELAVEAEGGCRHTAMMHSRNLQALHDMARKVRTTIFVKNGPSVAGLGFGGEGCTTMTIATPTGEGITTARTFTRRRRCVLKDHFRII